MFDFDPAKIQASLTRQRDLWWARLEYADWKRRNPDGDWFMEALLDRPMKGTDFIIKREGFLWRS